MRATRATACEVPEPELIEPDGFLGVDLGIANIATTSDGAVHVGRHLNQVRHRNRRLRARLQSKGTKSAKRLLHKLSGWEAGFAADVNHRISISIVTEAERTFRPFGPFQTLDVIGLKTAYHVAAGTPDPNVQAFAAALKEQYIDKGKLGTTTGEGFYTY